MSSNESQHSEWKAAWQDDHLRWVSGFANAEGGRLHIGRNDQDEVVGLLNAPKLLEDLPNKIRDVLGILVAVNLHETAGKDWLEIVVDAYPNPISVRGRYYRRSGSTLQELKGAALDRFLLRKQGRTWDGVPVPRVSSADLSVAAIAGFRKRAERGGRIELATLSESDVGLLEKLQLIEGEFLKRAAVLLFHPDPEVFVTGAFVKIGFFDKTGELVYHDEVRGDLFGQVERTLDLLLTKYLKAGITYEGVQRVERFPVPRAALREALLNALVHRDYAVGAPVQIRVYEDRLKLWNPAVLPEGWTLAKLLGEHASQPFNPIVANAFFRAGEIEAWGRGIHRIFSACRAGGSPEPIVQLDGHDLWLEFPYDPSYRALVRSSEAGKPSEASENKTPVETPVETPVKTPDRILAILTAQPHATLAEVAAQMDKSVSAVERASAKLVKSGRLHYVGPKKGGHWEVTKAS